MVVQGKMELDKYTNRLRLSIEGLHDLNSAMNSFATRVYIKCEKNMSSNELKEILSPYRDGNIPVAIKYANDNAEAEIRLSEEWNVRLEESFVKLSTVWNKSIIVDILYR